MVVPHGYLNRFTRIDVQADRDDKTGAVKYAYLYNAVDEGAILAAWEAAGFPVEWGFDEDDD